ncbi:MAG: TetR/AcrR family transcriptional regulator [Planctomycetales bacterium]|nr:TetR/AcrR family transcriptional regulator [Planctomycetales bacterium]
MAKRRDPLAPQPPPAPSRSDSSEIVEAIITATIELGDPDASMNHIARRAGVGVASVYRYFPNKGAIYAEISRRMQRDYLDRVRRLLERSDLSMQEAVEACCRAALVVPGASPELRRALNLAVPFSWSQDNAREVFTETIAEFTKWLAARLTPPPPDLAERVFAAFAAGRGLVMVSRVLPDLAPDDEALVKHMVNIALACLMPRRSPRGG